VAGQSHYRTVLAAAQMSCYQGGFMYWVIYKPAKKRFLKIISEYPHSAYTRVQWVIAEKDATHWDSFDKIRSQLTHINFADCEPRHFGV
jgi:hypothetical protein